MTFKNVVILPVKEFIYEHKTDWKSIYIGNVVGFLSAIHMGTLIATTWPYLKILNPSINEQTFGIIRGASSFANILASAFAGYVSNRTNDTKPSMIAAKVLAIISAVIYLLIEVITSVELGLFIASEIIHGISMGLMSVFRTYVAMNSTETDRSKAFGITMFAM
uniref:Major facilitator superfamily (MFS) profile domain-containing protein n=1 Tax=Panagrolaimus sp. JU765 TaxID=591449 RepID=A0AC34RKY6_9BILA